MTHDSPRSGERQPDSSDRSGERQRPDSPTRQRPDQFASKGHLPRLAPEFYRGHAFVHWTLTVDHHATGWLDPSFHHTWRHLLLHTCARYELLCPAYVLMPDHLHLLAAGISDDADQRLAIEFLRQHLAPALAPVRWQNQAHDHVLREEERAADALPAVVYYIFENPVRAGLVERWQDYPFAGCCVAGYPEIDPRAEDYWLRLWRIYNYLVRTNAS